MDDDTWLKIVMLIVLVIFVLIGLALLGTVALMLLRQIGLIYA